MKDGQVRIVCAAIQRETGGLIICGARHYDSIMRASISALADAALWYSGNVKQGFVDSAGNFLTRREAWPIADAAGQIIQRVGGDGEKLFSENLY